MITNIEQFKRFLEGYRMSSDDSPLMMTSLQQRLLAGKKLGIGPVGNKEDRTDKATEKTHIPKLRQMPGFHRCFYGDMNPKNKASIKIDPLDVVFEMQLDVPVWSQESDRVVEGDCLYYGWRMETETSSGYFFVTITTKLNGAFSYQYTNIHELSKEEMYDCVWQLTDAIDAVHRHEIDFLDPNKVTNDRLSDSLDYFN